MIEFQDVTVCYEPDKRHPVRSLDGLSLKIERGDWVFLVGPSGAGKSSLLRLIYAGMKAQSGRVLVDGADISGIAARDVPALRRKIGIVFQDFQLLSEKTAWENVAFALRVIGTPQSVIVREVPRALETVGLTHRADALPHELSGGEQQRIAIARAIVNNPPILLTDEPTGNLDPQTAREVGNLLTKINFERGTTIVMATHDGAFVDELARRVVRLKAGRIVSDLNPGLYGHDDAEVAPQMPPIPVQPQVAAPAAIPASPKVETDSPIAIPDDPNAKIVGPIIEIDSPIAIPDSPIIGIDSPIIVPDASIIEIDSPNVETSSGKLETPSSEVVAASSEAPGEIQPATISAPPARVEVAETDVVPVEAPVEAPKIEDAAPSVVPEAPKPVPEPKPAIPAGNWAQIAATAPKPVSNNVQLGHLDPYSVDGVQPRLMPPPRPVEAELSSRPLDEPAPRPMARRIAPPVPPPQKAQALEPAPADPTAPLGSPENPIVQYE